jgi:hypothetical protein
MVVREVQGRVYHFFVRESGAFSFASANSLYTDDACAGTPYLRGAEDALFQPIAVDGDGRLWYPAEPIAPMEFRSTSSGPGNCSPTWVSTVAGLRTALAGPFVPPLRAVR